MSTLIVTSLAAVSLLIVLLALRRDAPLDDPGPVTLGWDPLPARADLDRVEWPLRFPGYDPATVEQSFGLLADAYSDLLTEASPTAIARARARAVRRLGVDPAADRVVGAGAAPVAGATGEEANDPHAAVAAADGPPVGSSAPPPDAPSAAVRSPSDGLPVSALPEVTDRVDPAGDALRSEVVLAVLRRRTSGR